MSDSFKLHWCIWNFIWFNQISFQLQPQRRTCKRCFPSLTSLSSPPAFTLMAPVISLITNSPSLGSWGSWLSIEYRISELSLFFWSKSVATTFITSKSETRKEGTEELHQFTCVCIHTYTSIYIKGISKRKCSIWKGFYLALILNLCHFNKVHIWRHEIEGQTVPIGEASSTSPM